MTRKFRDKNGISEHFGKRLRQLISEAGYTPTKVAHILNVTKQTINYWLGSPKPINNIEILGRLSDLLRISLERLVYDYDVQPVKTEEHQLTIVIIDDNRTSRGVAKLIIKDAYKSASIHIFTNGEEALNWFETNRKCDLILVDYMMPGINGIEFAKMYRMLELDETTPIYLMSSMAKVNEIPPEELKSAGISELLRKPISPGKAKTLI